MSDLLKKIYVSPSVNFLCLSEDIITTSGPTPGPGEMDPMDDKNFEDPLI